MVRVLVVDDEPAILRSTAEVLAEGGFEVMMESDPSAIVERIRRWRPNVLLQDVRMPGFDIVALVSAIREDARIADTPIVLHSAGTELPDIAGRLHLPFLEKPTGPLGLLRAIEAAAGQSA